MAVKELGNDLEQIKNNEKLQQILTQATIMIVSVTASTTQGLVEIRCLNLWKYFFNEMKSNELFHFQDTFDRRRKNAN